MKKVTLNVFTYGDSNEIKTWSNIPYLFCETAQSKGVIVNKIDLSLRNTFERFFNRGIMLPMIRLANFIFRHETTFCYFRSPICYFFIKRRIRKACKQFSTADYNIFITYSFSSYKVSSIPYILFCDFTYEYSLSYFKLRKPDLLERYAVNKENLNIKNAYATICLFPLMSKRMKSIHNLENIFYLGNVVNMHKAPPVQRKEFLSQDEMYDIVFIGSSFYEKGAKLLMTSLDYLQTDLRKRIKIHLIGLTGLSDRQKNIHSYGYLDKGDPYERQIYYDILQKAKIFINPFTKWGAFSACVEAMYFFTPVLVCPYNEFVATFGEEINFGKYLEKEDSAQLAAFISWLLQDGQQWTTLSLHAHESVEKFLWESYMDKFLGLLK